MLRIADKDFDSHLFTGTVADNIRFGKLDATQEEIEKAEKERLEEVIAQAKPA